MIFVCYWCVGNVVALLKCKFLEFEKLIEKYLALGLIEVFYIHMCQVFHHQL